MSVTPSALLPSRPRLAEVQGRKRSFGRVFEKIRTVFRRRDDGRAVVIEAPANTVATPILAAAQIENNDEWTFPDLSPDLVVDDEENIPGSSDEPLVSLAVLNRTKIGMPEAKTRQLFERHGLTYHMRNQADVEPAAKLRRVEKPARMRVRWACHSCRADFGTSKICTDCGHQRCTECIREPSKKIRMSQLRDTTEAAVTAIRHPAGLDARPVSACVIQAAISSSKQPSWQCTIQIGRPRADSHTFLQARAQCHECEEPFATAQTRCSNCSHETCVLCPMVADRQPLPPMVPTVERVYKKPRQRVRYNCEHCNTQFTGRQECSGCGHERCETCPRFPPRKQKLVLDPAAWEALEARIATDSTTNTSTVAEPPLTAPEATPLARL